MRKLTIATLVAGTLLAGCSPAKPSTTEAAKTEATGTAAPASAPTNSVASAEPCADDGDRLPLSGLCQARGVNYVDFAEGPRPEADAGCDWVLSEVQMIDQVLLYMGQKCGDKTTKLEFSAGAKSAEITLTSSPKAGVLPDGEGMLVARVFTTDGADAKAAVLSRVREAIEDQAESARCVVKTPMRAGWPADAMVVEDPKVIQPKDEVGDSSCGTYGNSPDSSAFWRVIGDYAVHFDLGQDVWEIDPGSFTIVPLASAETTSDGAAGDSKAN
jgi:hypothetical protein